MPARVRALSVLRPDALLNSSISPWQSFPDESEGILEERGRGGGILLFASSGDFSSMRVCGDAENGPNVRGGERGMGGEGTEECEEGHQTHSLRLSHT